LNHISFKQVIASLIVNLDFAYCASPFKLLPLFLPIDDKDFVE